MIIVQFPLGPIQPILLMKLGRSPSDTYGLAASLTIPLIHERATSDLTYERERDERRERSHAEENSLASLAASIPLFLLAPTMEVPFLPNQSYLPLLDELLGRDILASDSQDLMLPPQ